MEFKIPSKNGISLVENLRQSIATEIGADISFEVSTSNEHYDVKLSNYSDEQKERIVSLIERLGFNYLGHYF